VAATGVGIEGWCSGRGAVPAAQELGWDVPGQATGSALQWRWRVKPQISQRATPLVGSTVR
jgi:hypothetical protein